MIVLDTNVLSELIRISPSESVKSWLNHKTKNQVLATTVITTYEITYGLQRLPEGKKKKQVQQRFDLLVQNYDFTVISLDIQVANLAGKMKAHRESLGLASQHMDMLIASMTAVNHAQLASNSKCKRFYSNGYRYY